MKVKAKKRLAQHFLRDSKIANDIVNSLQNTDIEHIIEVGPGMGILSEFILENEKNSSFVEIDEESIAYLKQEFPDIRDRIINQNFLKIDLSRFGDKIAVIGNFPYNISSQILFKILEHKNIVLEMVGMFQKELADRVISPPKSKVYGIISVFIQAYYDVEHLFDLSPEEFNPPPKVYSSVIRLTRNKVAKLDCDEELLWRVVHQTFNQRRKMIRNTIKSFNLNENFTSEYLTQRPEQLSVADFVKLTNQIEQNRKI